MKRCVFLLVGVALVVVAFAAAHHAMGRGFILAREGHRGVFNLEVHKRDDGLRGNLSYKDQTRERTFVEIRVPEIRHAAFAEHAVEFAGPGRMNGHPVQVTCRAADGGEKGDDHFGIVARRPDGQVAYEARGVVREGQIIIRHED